MKLHTKITLQPEKNQIDYSSKVLLLGSCFATNIGEKFEYFKFQNLVNPFGIIFHPIAIEKLVTRAINKNYFTDDDIFYHNEKWCCYEVHSELSEIEKETYLKNLNKRLLQLNEYLKSASHIIFTYGTSWVYRFIETDSIVANCYKVPQKKFLKGILSEEDISASIDNTITLIKSINPTVNVITTVSPVRHIKDGVIENTRSKAHLITGLHKEVSAKNRIYYFPSFEIMVDELRDYRFYNEDLIHPNNTAISIIWEAFKNVWISEETNTIQKEISTIQAGLQHKPFNPNSESHKLFLKKLQEKMEGLKNHFSHIKF
ncbi:MAG: GSCFA domain-containing protein [Flavobacteriaceae bacterium]|nr:GSCFA domain-containing protein [Flavobacteriaceae bacterium]